MNIAAIINPISGAGMDPTVASRRVAFIRDELSRRGEQASIHVTERGGHAAEIAAAAAAAHAELVIVWGGDGTLNEAGGVLAGTATALAMIPAGSGNGLAHALRVPKDPAGALDVALTAAARPMDVGVLGARRFLNVAGIGADARIASIFNRRARGRRGRWPYLVIGVREGCRYRAAEYRLRLDGADIESRALLIAFANGREYGMGAMLAPRAELDDGLLDAFVIEDRSVFARFRDARHLISGTVLKAPGVVLRKVRRAVIESAAPIEYHVDGEPGCADGRLEIGVLPKALNVKSPAWPTSLPGA